MTPFFSSRRKNAEPTSAIAAFRRGEWDAVIDLTRQSLVDGPTSRVDLLLAASAYERKSDHGAAGAFTTVANRVVPSPTYDSAAAFGVYAKAPYERDEIANFLVERRRDIRVAAEKAVREGHDGENTIFVYWDTDDRPPLVQRCIRSMRENVPEGWRLVELNAANLAQWIDAETLSSLGVARQSNLSDVIRTHLLAAHGGAWLDATVLLNDDFRFFLERIAEPDFFLFTYRGSRTGSWFFRAAPRSYRLNAIRAAVDAWLAAGGRWTNYFMFHDFVEMLYWTDERYRAEWDAGLLIHPREALAINNTLVKPVSDDDWHDLRRRSPVNKLNWKFTPSAADDPKTPVARLLAE